MARESSSRAPHESPPSLLVPSRSPVCVSPGGACCGGTARAEARSEESLYQSASNTIKPQTDARAKTAKISAELFSVHARAAADAEAPTSRIAFLNRRRAMRFRETIAQHFRRALVSR